MFRKSYLQIFCLHWHVRIAMDVQIGGALIIAEAPGVGGGSKSEGRVRPLELAAPSNGVNPVEPPEVFKPGEFALPAPPSVNFDQLVADHREYGIIGKC